MFPSLQPAQPFDIRAMSRSGLPAMSSPAMGMSPLGFSASRAPQMRSALTPSQMAFSRQLSSVTGISIPIAAQPGMGIVGKLNAYGWVIFNTKLPEKKIVFNLHKRPTDSVAVEQKGRHQEFNGHRLRTLWIN